MPKSSPSVTTTDLPLLRLRGPADLVYAVPYLLGFHPRNSLVLVGLDGAQLVVTARLDLADATDPAVVGHTVDAVCRGGALELVALVVADETRGGVGESWAVELDTLLAAVAGASCHLLDALLVGADRWWSMLCADVGCCPPDGTALRPPDQSQVAATATFAGLVALPDRGALAAQLRPRPAAVRDALWPALERARGELGISAGAALPSRVERSVKRALFAAARAAPNETATDETDVARFGAALAQISVRDAVWMAIDDRRLDGRPLWRELAARLPAPYDAPPLFLYGWAAWRHGDGALAGIAAEQAIDSDGGYSAADLLLAAVRAGVDPRRLPRLRGRRSA